jgi:hypothetical protein
MNCLRKTLFAVAALAGALVAAMAAPAHAGAGAENLTVVTPTNMNDVFAAAPSGKPRYVFVEVCPSVRKDCQDEVRKLALTAALAEGGWLGPDYNGTIDYYVMDPTPDNLRALAQACTQNPSAPASGLCQAGKTVYPLLVMYKTDGSKKDTLIGPVDDSNFAYMLRHFVK